MKDKKQLPITCPLCGRKNEFSLAVLKKGSDLVCPVCKVKINLHGHMWEEIESEMRKMEKDRG